jgi:hypothetical protein
MRFNYEVEDAGWANAEIVCGDAHIELTASYLHDSLCEVASSVLALLSGATEATAEFWDEGAVYHVIFRRVNEEHVDNVDIDVVSEGQKQFTCRTRLAHLRRQVLSALQQVLTGERTGGLS